MSSHRMCPFLFGNTGYTPRDQRFAHFFFLGQSTIPPAQLLLSTNDLTSARFITTTLPRQAYHTVVEP